MLRITQDKIDALVGVENADELCRLLLGNPGGWGRSTRHAQAVELLTRVHGTGELPFSLAVVLVCTCQRWDRVTAKLIAAIQDSGLLHDTELDELTDAFLAHDHVISYPSAVGLPAVARDRPARRDRPHLHGDRGHPGTAPRPARAAAASLGGTPSAPHAPGAAR